MKKKDEFLPVNKDDLRQRGWQELDVILITGDAYVDHPSFGAAVVGRVLEAEGLQVAIVPQPNWKDDLRDFRKLGKPRLFFGEVAVPFKRFQRRGHCVYYKAFLPVAR
mgnify:CR=1 FL=1